MESLETVYDEADSCRMCISDLSELTEYYSIDCSLRDLVLQLTGISIDINDKKYSTAMCPNCYEILEQFNVAKCSWISNQEKIEENLNEQVVENETLDEITKEDQDFEIADESSQNEFDFQVEYVEELSEFNEPDQLVEESQAEVKISPQRTKAKTRKSNNDDSKEKGKDVYQKLLKKCLECGKMIEKNRLDGHMNKHKNIRPYACDEEGCDKKFFCKLLFRLHKTSIHTGTLLDCEVCHKTFPSQRSLYAHSLRHKNENRYNCDYCERKFNNSNSLKRHMAIHSGIREWKCENCSASFYRKFNLDVHIKTVHDKEKSFACSFCPRKFGYSRLLRDHMKKNHLES